MLNHYPAWKNFTILAVVLIGAIVALPNLFGDDPAIQVSQERGNALGDTELNQVRGLIDEAGIAYESAFADEGRLMVRFPDEEQQLKAVDVVREGLGDGYVAALTLAPRTPAFLRAVGLRPMSLGLDLRGGVHFLYEVDMDAAIRQNLERLEQDFRSLMREDRVRYESIAVRDGTVRVVLRDAADLDAAEAIINEADDLLQLDRRTIDGKPAIIVSLSEEQIRQRQDFAIQQNTVTLRNRVNELGVAEPVVQRQGVDRIVVQLPGVQDPAQAERVLGATATLEFRLVDETNDPFEAQRRGRAPLGSSSTWSGTGRPCCSSVTSSPPATS